MADDRKRQFLYFAVMAGLLAATGWIHSWNVSLSILNLCLISAVMAIGVNIQWGFAGLFNVGIMGFAALGGLAAMLVSVAPVPEAWAAGGRGVVASGAVAAATILLAFAVRRHLPRSRTRTLAIPGILIVGVLLARWVFGPATDAIEKVNPASTGFLGGAGLPIILSWAVGGALAGAAAWFIGKLALGLRSDYLAIATLGISEIIVAILKSEDWLSRGVKNVAGLPRPVPYEIDLVKTDWITGLAERLGTDAVTLSAIIVKLNYALLFAAVLAVIVWLSERALNSPWGRMMRAIRDNEVAANAMGKDVTGRHLEVFVLGSVVVGVAGAMLTTLDGQLTPASYQPLRFTFLIWVMVIVGGSGNNWGSVLGGFLVWFLWIESEPAGHLLMNLVTSGMGEGNALRSHLLASAAHMRTLTMGVLLIVVLRFFPRGLIPERQR